MDPAALATGFAAVLEQKSRWVPAMLRARAAEFSSEASAEGYWQLLQRMLAPATPCLSVGGA
jgi:hypothetical protein